MNKLLRSSLIFASFILAFATSAFAQSVDGSLVNSNAVAFTTEATASDLENAKLSLLQVEQTIKSTKSNLRDYQEQLQTLTLSNNDDENFQISILKAKIQNQSDLLKLNEQRRDTIKKTIEVFGVQLQNEQQRLLTLAEQEQHLRHLQHEHQVQQQISTLSQEQSYWLNQITSLNNILSNKQQTISPYNYEMLLQKIFIAEENSNLTQFKINLLHINNALSNNYSETTDNASATTLNEQRQALTAIIDELEQNQAILTQKIELLQQRENLLSHKQNQDSQEARIETQIEGFINQYNGLLSDVEHELAQATKQQEKTATLLAKALARRQVLPGFNWQEWLRLGKGLQQMSVMSYQLTIATAYDIYYNLLQLDSSKKIKLSFLPFLAIIGYGLIRLLCNKIKQKLSTQPDNLLHRFLDNTLRIFISHLWFITLITTVVTFLDIVNISNQIINLTWNIGNTILVYSVALMIARLSLYENISNHSGADVKLYHRLCWLFSFGFIIALLMIISECFNSSYETQDLFNRLFMLFVFIIALMLLKASKVVPQFILPSISPKRNYLIRTIKLLAVLMPLIILSNAIIGLIGYVELAWTISKYEGLFLLITAGYLIMRGLFNDALNHLVTYIVRFRSGWIMTEVFIKPISIWVHVALFFASIYFLLYLYDLSHQAFIINYFYKFLHFTLIRFSNNIITVWLLIKAFVVALLFLWATKWAREFCYRKLYRNVRDIGARTSLAIFTQYGVCALGIIATLKTLQIDLTTLTFIATGLAVGIGFGLRDLANNFVSGIIILIERPMRRGDTVTIGEYEGKVLNIGLRATTVLSSDNREVIVPNAEAFSKTFINWTHTDDVIRCETSLKLHWQEDPHILRHEIEEAMLKTDGVFSRPAPEALLKGLTDGLLEFEIRFYFDYRVTDSRAIMKSRVLFNIWDRFSELGINPPYATHHIVLKDNSDDSNSNA